MKYMGSKSRIAKFIVPIIQDRLKSYDLHTYVEPFCGGCNIIDKVVAERKIACDKQEYLIELYKNLDKISTMPSFVTREHYSEVRESYNKKDGKFPKWYIGAIGFLASYNGRFFDGGYAGIVHTKANTVRNYYDEAKRNLENQIKNLQGIEFRSGDYRITCDEFKDCLIYCDIPYRDTKQYGSSVDFDYDSFWDWAKSMSSKNIVIISEHTARDDFKCIWEMPVTRTIDNTKRVNSIERLFEYRK